MHTTCSDGVYTPEELTNLAVQAGLDVMSISDHDTIDAYTTGCRLNSGVRIIPAMEMSSPITTARTSTFWAIISIRKTPPCRNTARSLRCAARCGPWKSSSAVSP